MPRPPTIQTPSACPVEEPIECDPREREEWFARLPDAMQDRCRAAWKREREGLSLGPALSARRVRRAARDSAIVMPALVLFANVFQFQSLPQAFGVLLLAAVAGAMAGAVLGLGANGRFRAAIVGALAFLPVQLTMTIGASMLGLIALFFGLLLAMCCYAVFGLCMEARARLGSGEV